MRHRPRSLTTAGEQGRSSSKTSTSTPKPPTNTQSPTLNSEEPVIRTSVMTKNSNAYDATLGDIKMTCTSSISGVNLQFVWGGTLLNCLKGKSYLTVRIEVERG